MVTGGQPRRSARMQQTRPLAALAAALALVALPALAQPGSAPRSGGGGPTNPPDIVVVPAPPEAPDLGPGLGPEPGLGRRPPPGLALPNPAARFHIRRGDLDVDIHCALREPMRNCVEAASALIDKLNGLTPPR